MKRTTKAACRCVAVTLLATLAACSDETRSSAEVIDDAALTTEATAVLAGEDLLSSARIDVESRDGEVQLSGFVNEPEVRALAEKRVQEIAGVKAIRNDIQVQPKPENRTLEDVVDDGVLVTRINAALVANPATKAHAINAESVNNVIQLSGFVSTEAERAEAGKVAAGVPGVREVRNDLQVEAAGRPLTP